MSKMKKVLLMATAYALVAALAIGGTVAYLTSDDSDVNVMTLGNVKIEQHEYERVLNEDGTYKTGTVDNQTSYLLQEFTQGKPLLPIVGDPNESSSSSAYAGWDDTTVRMSQVDSYGGMQVFAGKNAQDKFVTVENTGKTDAYVRTLVAFEIGTSDGSKIAWSARGAATHDGSTPWLSTQVGIINIDGNNYRVMEYVYMGAKLSDGSWRHENGVLPAGDTTYPNLSQIYLKHDATNEDMAAIDGNGNGTLDVLVLSQAVQTEGFDDAKTALDTAFGTSAQKAAEWFGGMANFEYVEAPSKKASIEGEAAAEILAKLQNGTDLIYDKDIDIIAFDTNTVDAKGATVTLAGVGPEAYGYLAFVPDAGEDVVVSNLNVTGSGFVEVGHYGQGNGNYTVNNVKIENLASTLANEDKGFTLGCAFMGYGTTTLNNCVMTGATAVQKGVMAVDLGCGNNLITNINDGEYGTVYCWSNSKVTVDGADVDTMYVAPINGTITIKAGTNIGTLNVDYGTYSSYATDANLAKIVIEEGANVDTIVFNGQSYTLAQWNAR